MEVLSALSVPIVLDVLGMVNVLNLQNVLDVPINASLACWALVLFFIRDICDHGRES